MRPILVAAFIAVSALIACRGQPATGVNISHARAGGNDCTYSDETIYAERGSFDSAFGSSYLQIFGWENNLGRPTLAVGSSVLAGGSNNDFIAKEAVLSFQADGYNLPNETFALSALIAAGSDSTKNSVRVPLITGAIAEKFIGITKPVILLTTFQLQGTTQGGDKLSTQPFTYPIEVYNSGFSGCPPKYTLVLRGECGQPGKNLGVFPTPSPATAAALYCAPPPDAGTP